MRRPLLLTAAIALVVAASAAASPRPLHRDVREASTGRARVGTIEVPPASRRGLTRVVVRLAGLPLAAWNAGRVVSSSSRVGRLDAASPVSAAYLARLDAQQRTAAAAVRAAIPRARIQERFSILLDGFAVQLPARDLPRLLRIPGVRKVYPSLAYYATMDRGPSVIHATDLAAATGDKGQGVKIAVVDTGVDPASPFLAPAGLAYPPGFPRGDHALTTPKVIVAKVFPSFPRDENSTRPFDGTEPHGTHVAGIAAGDEGTNAPLGLDHPPVLGLSGVAPKAWIGNYRVFTIPTPFGHEADTPEIIRAFEAAVADGMNVINFSGGGAQTDPANDALLEAVRNVALAGVVPVIAAGNDRDDFGLGSTGSPGVAPDAITVAAVSNAHVFAPALSVVGGPPTLASVPVQIAAGGRVPRAWSSAPQTLVDVGAVLGTDRKPVEAHLCGPPHEPNTGLGTLPKGSLSGKIVLVSRGGCTYVSKAERALLAGAAGIVLVDNRPGEANQIPLTLPIPSAMVADLDGARLRSYLAGAGGSARVRVTPSIEEIQTGRSGVIASFSSAGPTDFGWFLKPDIAAPGLDVLSSTPPLTTGSPFAVFAGTSMATPHVAGAAALLLQRHPAWTAHQVKSALMSTAGPAWADTARTQEASVLLEGAGLANVAAADDPRIFTEPQSLSFARVDVSHGDRRAALLLTVSDAGDGAGAWSARVAPQTQTAGVQIDVPASVTLTPGGFASIPVTVTASAAAEPGENDGFVVLSASGVTRRVPYAFLVERPALGAVRSVALGEHQTGDTSRGPNRVTAYCCPSAPFGQPPDYTGPPMVEDGSETLYSYEIDRPAVNFGVSVAGASAGALIDPFVLGSKDENDVQGYAGVPVDVNALTFDSQLDIGAAGVQFPRLQTFYVAVDSRADPFTQRPQKGKYLLKAWVDDLTPPKVQVLTTRVTAGRPLVVARATDSQSGVDPLSLVISYGGALVGASAYDPASGLTFFGIPADAPAFKPGRTGLLLRGSDYQESKNLDPLGGDLYPNTAFRRARLTIVRGPTVTWVAPAAGACAPGRSELAVVGASTRKVRKVEFTLDGKRIGVDSTGPAGIYSAAWKRGTLRKGRHLLVARLTDATGRTAAAARAVSACG